MENHFVHFTKYFRNLIQNRCEIRYAFTNANIVLKYCITRTSQWARWRLKSPEPGLLTNSTVCLDAAQRENESLALTFVRGIHRRPVNSPHKGPITPIFFHLMTSSWVRARQHSSHAMYKTVEHTFSYNLDVNKINIPSNLSYRRKIVNEIGPWTEIVRSDSGLYVQVLYAQAPCICSLIDNVSVSIIA